MDPNVGSVFADLVKVGTVPGIIIPLLAPGGAHAADEDPRGGGAQDARVPLPVRAVSQAVQQAG